MTRNETIALEILDEIDRARSGTLALDELERRLWRLLEKAEVSFPRILAGQVESLVPELRRQRRENLAFTPPGDSDEDRGCDALFNEVTSALGRYVG